MVPLGGNGLILTNFSKTFPKSNTFMFPGTLTQFTINYIMYMILVTIFEIVKIYRLLWIELCYYILKEYPCNNSSFYRAILT